MKEDLDRAMKLLAPFVAAARAADEDGDDEAVEKWVKGHKTVTAIIRSRLIEKPQNVPRLLNGELVLDNRTVRLTPTEYLLLCQHARNPAEVHSREELNNAAGLYGNHALGVAIHRFRKKIPEDIGEISCARGRGFVFRINLT